MKNSVLVPKCRYRHFGTSLSKCHGVINRFSEDIDVTIDIRLSQGQKRKVKQAIIEIAEDLELQIPNIEDTRSRHDYNRYLIEYPSVFENMDKSLPASVLLETSFSEVSYPTVLLPVQNYIWSAMTDEPRAVLSEYKLDPFYMKVQSLERTLVDKVFAICDYYLKNTTRRHSRHLYDIYKLLPLVPQDDAFASLIMDVRQDRALNERLCPSASPEINISELLFEILEKKVYKRDYEVLTKNILGEDVSYETAVTAVLHIAKGGLF